MKISNNISFVKSSLLQQNGLKTPFHFKTLPLLSSTVRYLNHFQSSQLNITFSHSLVPSSFFSYSLIFFLIFSVNRIYLFIFIFKLYSIFSRVLLNIDTNSIFIINAINENPQIHIFINISLYICVYIYKPSYTIIYALYFQNGVWFILIILCFLFFKWQKPFTKNKAAAPQREDERVSERLKVSEIGMV